MYSLAELLVEEDRWGEEGIAVGGERCFGVELADSGGGVGMRWGLLSALKPADSMSTSGGHVVVLLSPRGPKSVGSSKVCEKGDVM